jgi:signal transduction histidine kinase
MSGWTPDEPGRPEGGDVTQVAVAAPRGHGLQAGRHLRTARRSLIYLVVGLGQGLTYLLLIGVGLLLGLALSPLWRAPLEGTSSLVWRFAESERRQANRMLDTHLPALNAGATGREFWRTVAMLLLKLPFALVALALAAIPVLVAVALLVLGLSGLTGGDGRLVGPWELGPGSGVLLIVLAFPAAVVAVAALEGDGMLARVLARRLLRSRVPEGGPVRELLAERLGDRSLNIAYWLPQRGIFVDERGRPVTLPEPGSGRTWTAVEHEGTRVAAIVHDAELDASAELVSAAASAAALAIDNERLKAELRARVEELRLSRVRIVEAADDERRRIERDLHEGAQQQLVSLALDLRMLKARLGDSGLQSVVDELGDKLAEALAELREFGRGIHPAILSDRGLKPAVEALVDRSPLTVDWDVALSERLPPAVEAAAYYVIAEGLSNVARYANTDTATVTVRRDGGEVEVVVRDEGVGGATIAGGTSLRGLLDRLAVLDGSLTLDSPPGGGTRLEARIPIDPDSLVAEATQG